MIKQNNNSRTTIVANERSEGGVLITEMNKLFDKRDWEFKSAVGELSVKSKNAQDNRSNALFPDAIVFADKENLLPIIGWEFKMPDTSIEDDELFSNAKDKANRLGTNVIALWNFQYCHVFYRKDNGKWSRKPDRVYDQYANTLVDRKSVHANSDLWKKQINQVLEDLNNDYINSLYKVAPIQFNIENYVETISDTLTPLVAEYLIGLQQPTLMSKIRVFASKEQAELNKKFTGNDKAAALTYSKNIVIRWINRIIFSNLIRAQYNDVSKVLADFISHNDIFKLKTDFNKTVSKTDFFTIMHVDEEETKLPESVVDNLAEFCAYLWKADLSNFNSSLVSSILEALVTASKHKLMGLYTTPANLAHLLAQITMESVKGNFADFTVGSGTIAKAIINNLEKYHVPMSEIHKHVWASDKYSFPLQVANFNMTTFDSLNLMNIVFKRNALELQPGDEVTIVNPKDGKKEQKQLPQMKAIMSNLPFVSSNNRSQDDKDLIKQFAKSKGLDLKIDLYQAILLHYKSLLSSSSDARIGVITSNSWFKNKNGESFFDVLSTDYDIKCIIYSDVARWFDNADVVAAIVIVGNKSKNTGDTHFISLKKDIRRVDASKITEIADQIMAGEMATDNFSRYDYSLCEVDTLTSSGLCLEALFDDIQWFKQIISAGKVAPLTNFCNLVRGTRTGGDAIFVTKGLKTNSEDSVPYLKSVKDISSYIVNSTDNYFFYTTKTLEQLQNEKRNKTLAYINRITNTPRAKKQREKHGEEWYIAEDSPKYGDFVTTLNADKRWFWSVCDEPIALNQRLVIASLKPNYKNDKKLIHALLNSVISLYILCGSGFARADGVTDITKDGISRNSILNPDILDNNSKKKIEMAWDKIQDKPIVSIFEELEDPDWIAFNKTVLKAYKLDADDIYKHAKSAIYKLIKRRENIKQSKKS